MREEELTQSLMDYALRALSRRAHTIHEMMEKLKKRPAYSETRAKNIIERLKELKFLDDEAYIQRAIEQAVHFHFHGRHRVAQKLYQKGISPKKLDEAWDAMSINEQEVAENALRKLAPKLRRLPSEKHYNKKVQFLSSRGFSSSIVFELAKNEETS